MVRLGEGIKDEHILRFLTMTQAEAQATQGALDKLTPGDNAYNNQLKIFFINREAAAIEKIRLMEKFLGKRD